MKKMIVVVILVFLVLGGCALGSRKATLNINDNGKVAYDDKSSGFFLRSIDPEELANAKATIIQAEADADLIRSLASQLEEGKIASVPGKYVGVIINDDPEYTAYVPHPEISQKIKIRPGYYKVIYTNEIPDKITIYRSLDNYYQVADVHKKSGVYNGIAYDYGVRIYKLY